MTDKNYSARKKDKDNFNKGENGGDINSCKQRVGLIFVSNDDYYAVQELTQLVETAKGVVVFIVNQNRQFSDPATLIGSGKLEEVAKQVELLKIDVLVFERQLSPIQHRNISNAVDCLVVDRTDLILDIFALRATTAEGKLQVELAQLNYELPRLRSEKGKLTRQGGGIGTRGPGETKLETDKRRIRAKLTVLKERLKEVEKQRALTRLAREEKELPQIAIVGYTNAGKSTLFNTLTNSKVLAEDKLFATLETTARRIVLPSGITALIFDTVGFIKNLPHNLVEAFKSTLEEAKYADILLNVCDCSYAEVDEHIKVTESLLEELGANGQRITVFNKLDINPSFETEGKDSIAVSAVMGQGLTQLLTLIDAKLLINYISTEIKVNYDKITSVRQVLEKYAVKYDLNYQDDEVKFSILINKKYFNILLNQLKYAD